MNKILVLGIFCLLLVGSFVVYNCLQDDTKVFCDSRKLQAGYTGEVKCYEYKIHDGEYEKIREVKS